MNNQELQILISMRDEFSQKLTGVENSLKKSVTEANKASISFKKLAVSIGGMATVYASLRFAMSSVKEFAELEESQMRLEKIVMNATGATKEQIQVLHDQAKALQAVGVVDRQTIASAQAKLATFDMSIDAIKKLTPALLDYAVAEYGVGVSSEQITNAAQGFGKALQGNTELLTKNGFVISEYEKQVLETGNEIQRLAMFNEILGRTYKDVNEEMAKTSAGAMKQMQNQITDLKVEIGEQLTPIVLEFVQTVSDNMPVITLMAREFSIAIKEIVSWLSILPGISKGTFGEIKRNLELESGLNTLNSELNILADNMYKAKNAGDEQSKSIYLNAMQAKSAEANILKLQKAEKALADEIERTAGGNSRISKSSRKEVEEAGFKVDFAISGTKLRGNAQETLDKIREDIKAQKDFIESKKDDLTKLAEITIPTKTNLPPIISEEQKKKLEKDKQDLEKAREVLAKALIGFSDEYKKFNERVSDQLFDLEENHKSAVAGFKQQINSIRASMKELNESFGQGEKSDRMKVAEQIVANEERIAQIQTELAGEVEKNKRREMEAELATMQQSMLDNADFINGLDAETAEVKRRASLTELERAIEDFNARRAVAIQEYNEKKGMLQNQMHDVRQAQKEEKALYQEKKDFIQEQIKSAERRHAESMASNLLTTKETIQKEIEYYRQLATAMDAVRGSNTVSRLDRNIGKVSSVNDAIIAPNGNIISTHPDDYLIATKNPQSLTGGGLVININTMVGDEAYAEELGNKIISVLGLQGALSN